jgi:hypothetical protein
MAWKEGRRSPDSVSLIAAMLGLSKGLKSLLVGDVSPNGSSSAILGFNGVMWNSVARGDLSSSSRESSVLPKMSLGKCVATGEVISGCSDRSSWIVRASKSGVCRCDSSIRSLLRLGIWNLEALADFGGADKFSACGTGSVGSLSRS